MTLFEIDPNVVKPGWTPLLIVIGLACVMVLLYLSMRRQFRKINASAEPGNGGAAPGAPAESPEAATDAEQAVDISHTRPGPGRT